jgi:hypothetical protein
LHHVEREAERLDVLAMAVQIIDAPVARVAGRVDADVPHAELGPDLVI